jgi:hypothetical protein
MQELGSQQQYINKVFTSSTPSSDMSPVDAEQVGSSKTSQQSLLCGPGGRYLGRTWLRLALFFLPIFVLVVPSVYYLDPFGLFAKPSVIPDPIRSRYAQQVNQVLWKLPSYNRDPAPNILLGDSEMARLPDQVFNAVTGQKYSNLAYGGGTLRESISTFSLVDRKAKLQKVLFGISFMEYNAYPLNRVTQVEEIARNPALYFLNSDVLETAVYDVADAIFHHHTNLMPQVSKDAFWVSQLQYLATRYKRESSPGSLKDEIREIVESCRARNISIVFVIPPQHMDAQRRIRDLGVENEYQQFKDDLTSMAPVYDCDIDSDLTRNKGSYSDPFHLTDSAAVRFAEDLSSGNPKWCRTLGVN